MTKTVHRFAPYPIYDFEETTKWLEEMAANGYILKKYRTFLRTASFTKGAPQNIRYGITPKPKSIHRSLSSLEELTAICEAQGWHYMEKIENYCLFNTTDPQAPDLFTDQESYLQSLKTILKKQYRSVLLLLPCLLVYMYILCSSNWYYIIKNGNFFLLLSHWMIFIELLFTSYIPFLMETFYLRKYVKTVEKGEPAKSSKFHKTLHKITVWGAVFAVLSVYICLLFSFKQPAIQSIAGASEPFPFASIQDYYLQPVISKKDSDDNAVNYYKKTRSPLMPVIFDYQENASVHFADDVTDDCQLNVTYVETNYDWLAESILNDFKKNNQIFFSAVCQPLDIGEDDIETYYFIKNNVLYLLQRKDNIIVSSSLTYYLQYALDPEETARISAQHLK